MDLLKQDLAELKSFAEVSKQFNVKFYLNEKISEIEKKLNFVENQNALKNTPVISGDLKNVKSIKNYSWDQSDNFVKIYISMPGLEGIDSKNISIIFENKSVNIKICGLNNLTYQLLFNDLFNPIVTEKSSYKVSNGMLSVFLKKESPVKWESMKAQGKKQAPIPEAPKPSDDPTKGLMDMVKKMYTEGDEDTKKMLNKAMSEAYSKQGQMPGI